jgi:adenylosuccinate synthase
METRFTGMTTYDELPIELKEYIEFIERELKFNQNLSWSRQKTNHLKIIHQTP